MLIPVEWLRDFVALDDSAEQLADRLTLTGNEIEEIRQSESGPVFYLKLTPNRADMLAIRGAAREIAALYDRPFAEPDAELDDSGPAETGVRVDVERIDLCPRYIARVIRGVRVGPSPEWLRRRLEAAGERSINNVVDATNYVMLEYGQPLHAFDLDKLTDHRIIVRMARPGERFIAIGGDELTLTPETLVIADGARAVAIAGVKGGQETEVTAGSTDILLEAAYFDPVGVRRAAKRTGVSSSASYRFERGVDPNGVAAAADRAAALIAQLTGGVVSRSVHDVYPVPVEPRRIPFRPERCRALLGVAVPDEAAESFLVRLGLEVDRGDERCWTVTAPTRRVDLAIEEDLIEEVGRLFGYDRLPETLPAGAAGAGALSPLDRLTRRVRELLTAQGLSEAVTSSLVAGSFLERLHLGVSPAWAAGPAPRPAPLRNALSAEFDTLRPSLLPGLLQTLEHNLRHGRRDVFLFEAGWVHGCAGAADPADRFLVAGLLFGSRWAGAWNPEKGAADFFTARGVVETLAGALNAGPLAAEPLAHPAFHPGRTALLRAAGETLGVVGELHPGLAQDLDLPRGVYLFELDGPALLAGLDRPRRYAPPSRFPRALRDVAVVVPRSAPAARVEAILREEARAYSPVVRLFDVYAGHPLPEDRVSLAYSLELGAPDRTLTDEEVEAALASARRRLAAEVGAEFRDR
jgi:phenylalanyl-tRNA synthetase beta chain